MKRKNVIGMAVALFILNTPQSKAATIGTFKIDTLSNTAGCPFTGNPADRNPFSCPTLLPPGPIVLDLIPGDYQITAIAFGPDGPANAYIWDGNGSSGESYAAPNVLGGIFGFVHTNGQVALYDYDWYPFDNDLLASTTLQVSSVAPEPGTILLLGAGLLIIGVWGKPFRRERKALK